jgi:hypothetical protein
VERDNVWSHKKGKVSGFSLGFGKDWFGEDNECVSEEDGSGIGLEIRGALGKDSEEGAIGMFGSRDSREFGSLLTGRLSRTSEREFISVPLNSIISTVNIIGTV